KYEQPGGFAENPPLVKNGTAREPATNLTTYAEFSKIPHHHPETTSLIGSFLTLS
ncbi:MAG: hypothetical protein RLZZ436_2869, partial [Planctomycetota bacterium]